MKHLILSSIILSLAGCAVVPSSNNRVIVYPAVRVSPTVDIVYMWDPVQYRYYYVDRRNSRHYMPHDWRHPHGHRPPGHNRWHDKK